MFKKEMVLNPKTGRYEERYVDHGPKRARPGHDAGLRRGTTGPGYKNAQKVS